MKTKIVYVLVSNEGDNYTEQFFISSYSVKYYNPDATIFLLTDTRTENYLNRHCHNSLSYVDKIVSVDYPSDFDNKKRSRYLKTSVRNLIEGDYLFIDTDTIICDDLSSIDYTNKQIAAVYDMHVPVNKHASFNEIKYKSHIIGYELQETDEYFNSGIMFVKDTEQTREFYESWQKNYKEAIKKGVSTDQQALLKTNSQYCIISELDASWNCQIINNIADLWNAKIIHYFCTGLKRNSGDPVYKFMSRSFLTQIRERGFVVDDELKRYVNNPRSLFTTPLVIISGDDMKIKYSLQYHLLSQLFYRHNSLFEYFEKILTYCRKLKRSKFVSIKKNKIG